jgi:hypothetical protein
MSSEAAAPKAKRRNTGKTSNRQDDQKVKVTLYVPADLARRFATHAVYTDLDKSALFAEMIREHCKRFVVSDRAKVSEDQVEPAE